MTPKNKTILLISLLSILVSGFAGFLWQKKTPKKPDDIPLGDFSYTLEFTQHSIEQLMKQYDLPSVAIAMIDDQDTIWQETFGLANLEEKIPAEADTVYKLWSIAKVFTAIETIRLVDDGLIDLDVPIESYFPEFSIQSRFPYSSPITIRKILTHRSGLPRNECHWVDLGPGMLADLVNSLEDCHLVYPVGHRYKYSNIGFDMLGYLIEKMRGESFPEYMRDNLLLPVGMDNSAFLRTQIPDDSKVAFGYEYYKGEYYPYEQGDITSLPSGNLYASIEDMGNFVKFIFREGKVGGEQIITPDVFDLMFTEQDANANDPQPMGLGWKIANVLGSEHLIWHDGGPGDGTGSLVAFIPERKLGVVLISNSTSFEGNISVQLALDILEIMLETKYGIIAPVETKFDKVEIDRTKLDRYVGKYIAFGEVMEIYLKGNQLKGKIAGFTFSLDPLRYTVFQPRHWLADLGLAALLGVPIDLRQLKIEFMPDDDVMIINISDITYEFCPKYPDIELMTPLQWDSLMGEYDLVARLPFGVVGTDVLGHTSIQVEDGVLQMSGFVGPLMTISETEIIIMSGSFAGETMVYEPVTGSIYHQNIVYKQLRERDK